MVTASVSQLSESTTGAPPKQAENIAPLHKEEAAQIANFELNQVLSLLEQLDGEDWTQPTDCTEWNVHDMTAHLAGACAGWASWGQFLRQVVLNPHMRQTDVPVDAINKRQLQDRAGKAPQALIDELRAVGATAVRTRRNLPGVIRRLRIDAKPMPGKMSFAYLVDVIYPRDQWMHRMDICRATGKTLVITPAHDERLLDLVMLDVAETLGGEIPVQVNITGGLTTSYCFGDGEPQAELNIDFHEFNRRASMRTTAEEARQTVTVRGDEAVVTEFLQKCPVLY